MGSEQRATSGRYLYERLDDKRFQELCGALLVRVFPDVTCYPVGQSDGGRDAVLRSISNGDFIYQVKWTSKPERNPVGWLDQAIKGEAENIRRLVSEGATHYYLLTSIAGTADPKRGTMDKLDERLAEHSKAFGIPMQCWWRPDIDARVDDASTELKWTYQEMLAGADAVRYVSDTDKIAAHDQELRAVLLKVLATQWSEDSKVKFKQVELDSHYLVDLFVDVEALRVAAARRSVGLPACAQGRDSLGGAAAYLLTTKHPLTLVRGEPGQGKSTLGQFICQVHRAEFLPSNDYRAGAEPSIRASSPRLPLRADLRDYATWLTGHDPFTELSEDDGSKRQRPTRPTTGSLEQFLASLVTACSGGVLTSVEQVQDILYRFPMLVVLDGLDEVAWPDIRSRVVREIDAFASRLGNSFSAPQVVVTTRPNASNMPEPSTDMFETIALSRLTPKLRTTYLRRWADAQSISGKERRELERTFRQRSAEPHVLQLADNPMQLTILLYLMRVRGNSVPTGRTDLYTSYMEKFLDREAAKTPAVDEHRDDLEEVTAYLGWYLQSVAETTASNGQVATKALKKAILDYLFEIEKDTSLVDALFTAVTDRVWALTSKVQGTFEFDVQPLREYFAAKFLYEFAGADRRDFDPSVVLRHLVRHGYWLNTSRFYAGFARPNELSGLVDGLAEELESESSRPQQTRLATWTLLSDGVFSAKPRTQRQAVKLLGDDLSVRLLTNATRDPEMAGLPIDRGGRALAELVQNQLVDDPHSPIAFERAQLLARLIQRDEFEAWWRPHIRAAGTGEEQRAWLAIGTPTQAAARLTSTEADRLDLRSTAGAVVAARAGLAPEAGSELDERLTRAVLDGQCFDVPLSNGSEAADLLRAAPPQFHLARASKGGQIFHTEVGHLDAVVPDTQQQAAFRHLKARDGRFGKVQTAQRFNKGQARTTSPWGNTARALADIYGPCWLAAEIAVTGAALPDRYTTGGDITKESEPLGNKTDYGRLLQDVRFNRTKTEWWQRAFDNYEDELSRATWALALLSAAAPQAVSVSLTELAAVCTGLSNTHLRALVLGSSRLGASELLRRLPAETVESAARLSPIAGLLVAHHATSTSTLVDLLPTCDESQLAELSCFDIGAWPAVRALASRFVRQPNEALLAALRRYGAQTPLPPVQMKHGQEDGARTILDQAADYPLALVLEAERLISAEADNEALANVAAREMWFDF